MESKILYDDGLELIDSRTFIHYGKDKHVTISLTEEDGTNINVRLEFVYNKDINTSLLEFSEYNKETLKITLKHRGRLLNYGYSNPIYVGSFNGHELFFNLRVDINNTEDCPLITYTWFIKRKN